MCTCGQSRNTSLTCHKTSINHQANHSNHLFLISYFTFARDDKIPRHITVYGVDISPAPQYQTMEVQNPEIGVFNIY